MKSQLLKKGASMLAASFVLCLFPLSAVSEQYLGEFCWDVIEGEATDPRGLLRLNVYAHEGGDFSLRGTMDDFVFGVVFVANGSADLVPAGPTGGTMVSVAVQGSTPGATALVNMTLDPATLSGSHSGFIFLSQPTLTTQTTIGEMIFSQCPP